jgi:hypothetical protein
MVFSLVLLCCWVVVHSVNDCKWCGAATTTQAATTVLRRVCLLQGLWFTCIMFLTNVFTKHSCLSSTPTLAALVACVLCCVCLSQGSWTAQWLLLLLHTSAAALTLPCPVCLVSVRRRVCGSQALCSSPTFSSSHLWPSGLDQSPWKHQQQHQQQQQQQQQSAAAAVAAAVEAVVSSCGRSRCQCLAASNCLAGLHCWAQPGAS